MGRVAEAEEQWRRITAGIQGLKPGDNSHQVGLHLAMGISPNVCGVVAVINDDATCDVCDSPMPEAEAARLRDAAAPPPVLPLLAADPRLQQIPEPEAAAPKRKPRDALAQFLRRNAPPKKKRRARFFAA